MRQTAKYKRALEFSELIEGSRMPHDSQAELYQRLNDRGCFWNPDRGLWEESEIKADPPTQLIKIRVWADKASIQSRVEDIVYALQNSAGFQLQEQSEVYVCRPPKHLEARIYLTFKR